MGNDGAPMAIPPTPYLNTDAAVQEQCSPAGQPMTENHLLAKANGQIIHRTALDVAGAQPACVITLKRRILQTNAAFKRLIEKKLIALTDTKAQPPRLRFVNDQYQQAMLELLDTIASGGAGDRVIGHHTKSWCIIAQELASPVMATSGLEYPIKRQFLMRFIELSAPTQTNRHLAHIEHIFGLTPAEANLCAALLEAASLPQAAQMLGIKTSTARTQLKSIFNKVDVRSQTALVAELTRIFVRLEIYGAP